MNERGTRTTWRPLVMGIIIGLVIALAAVWVVTGESQSARSYKQTALPSSTAGAIAPTSTPTPEPAASPDNPDQSAPPAPVVPAYDSACGLTGGSAELPDAAPADLTWHEVDGWAFPASASAGPGVEDRSCFARTPTGAVMATYVISMMVDGFAEDFESVVTEQTVPGAGQTARLATGAADVPADVVVPAGFVIDQYTADEATVSLYLLSQGMGFTCAFTVQWLDGDWRLKLQPNGQTPAGWSMTAPAQYVPWGP